MLRRQALNGALIKWLQWVSLADCFGNLCTFMWAILQFRNWNRCVPLRLHLQLLLLNLLPLLLLLHSGSSKARLCGIVLQMYAMYVGRGRASS